jgi:hypothetical protein
MWVENLFWHFFKTQFDISLNKAQHKQELRCGKIFGSDRNMYVIEEPFFFHSTPDQSQNQGSTKINTNSDITPPNKLDMVTFEILPA